MTERNERSQATPARRPTAQGGHICFDPGFVDKDQTAHVDAALTGFPLSTAPRDVSARLLAGEHGFF